MSNLGSASFFEGSGSSPQQQLDAVAQAQASATAAAASASTASSAASAVATAIPAGDGKLFSGTALGGSLVPITLGTNLALAGTTLNATGGGGSGSPGGTSGQLQYNNAGAFAGATVGSGLSFSAGTLSLSYSYTLPAATTSTLGGVIVGTGLGVTTGTVSVTYGATTPAMDGTGAVGTANTASRSDHVHPTDTSRYAASNPSGYQTAAQVSSAISAAAYSLPTASTTILGGVKVDGSSITISAGVISANTSGGVTLAVAGTDPVPVAAGTAAVGSSGKAAREDHVHPTDTTRAPLDSPAFTTKLTLPAWTTGTRPAAATGVMGVATDISRLEVYTGAAWAQIVKLTDASGSNPQAPGTAAPGTSSNYARGDHVHPSDTTRLAVANNLSDLASAATARTNLGVSALAFGVDFSQGVVVANGTINVVRKAPFAMTINSLDYEVGSAGGSFTVAVQIAGTNVTGLSAVAVSSATSANAAASGANTVSAGQQVTIVISSTSGSPTGANLQINATR